MEEYRELAQRLAALVTKLDQTDEALLDANREQRVFNAEQREFNRQQRDFNAQQVMINSRLETLMTRALRPESNGTDA
jgi:hypothetical protein